MEQERGPSGSEGLTVLRVAVMVNGACHLRKIDVSCPVEEIVKELCFEYRVPYEKEALALWTEQPCFDNGSKFISDDTKYRVPVGSILILKQSPTKLTEELMRDLTENGASALCRLAVESEDSVVLGVLHAFGAHEHVFKILSENLETSVWVSGLAFLRRLYLRRLIRRVPSKILSWLFASVARAYEAPKEFILQCLLILSAVRRFGRLRYEENLFDHLAALLFLRDQPELQEAGLELLNFLVLFPNNPEEESMAVKRVVSQRIVGCICDNILRETPSKGMQQQLYRYQTLILRPYWHKKVTKVMSTDPAMETIRRLTHRAKRGELLSARRRVLSEGDDAIGVLSPPLSPRSGLLGTLMSSFRWPRGAVPRSLQETSKPSTPLTPDSDSPAATTSRSRRILSPKSRRKGPLFYSCIESSSDNEKPADIEFNFYGPIFHISKDGNRMSMKKSASTSNLTLPVNVDSMEETVVKDPALSSRAVSELTIENLKYQALHYPEQYQRWATAKSQSYVFAEQLTHVVCRLLEVGRPRAVDSPGDGYHPLVFFVFPFVVEELFCEAFVLYDRTSKEMKARGDRDVPKVMAAVQEQIGCALNPKGSYLSRNDRRKISKPMSMDHIRDILSKITYQHIAQMRRHEREERMIYDLRNKPLFLEYRERCKSEIRELIQKQRWRYITDGHHLVKVNNKGDIQKNAREFLGLNRKGDQLIVGECQSLPKRCRHTRSLPVEDIVDVSVGKQSKFYKDLFNQNENWLMKAPEEPEHWNNLFSLKMKDNVYHNFCATDLTALHYWADVFNLLLGKPMNSPTMELEMQEFLDLEVRLHFLDVEGLPLPDHPPLVPPPPPNYDFLAREKRRNKR